MSKSAGHRLADAATNINALRKIIMKFLQGGWKAAALEAVKHYWPYILAAVAVILFLPMIIVFSLPSFFGSGETGVFINYETYVDSRFNEAYLKAGEYPGVSVEIVGQQMSKNEMNAACLVLSGNNTEIIDEAFLIGCVNEAIIFGLHGSEINTETEIFVIRCLSLEDFLTTKGCGESDIEWAVLITEDLNNSCKEEEENERDNSSNTD